LAGLASQNKNTEYLLPYRALDSGNWLPVHWLFWENYKPHKRTDYGVTEMF